MARRDAERIEREKRLQTVLAEFFHAQGEAERIRAAADDAAAPFDAAMRDSARALDELGETRAGIASLIAAPLTRVREYLVDDITASTANDPKSPDCGGDGLHKQPNKAHAPGPEAAVPPKDGADASL
jgi:hypothetical protein